jgi:hypothetical protein
MFIHYRILFFLCVLGVMSCEKKEKPITLPPKGDGSVMQVDMGEKYEYQYYISLDDQKIVFVSRSDQWDLAFESASDKHAIYLNGGQGMAAIPTGKTQFANVTAADTSSAAKRWRYDEQHGGIDSTAFGDWLENEQVYIVRLNGTNNKLRKIKITYVDAFQYMIEAGDINAVQGQPITIVKKENNNYTYFSFDLLKTVDGVEPDDHRDWDLQATLYSYVFYDQNPPLPYVVNGILLNPLSTTAYKDSLNDYNAIDLAFTNGLNLSADRDVIGFNWKSYDIDKNVFTVVPKYSFIVKTKTQSIYKLKFLDFYSSTGVKGSPKFEFKRLK